jgi:hypothetical protein
MRISGCESFIVRLTRRYRDSVLCNLPLRRIPALAYSIFFVVGFQFGCARYEKVPGDATADNLTLSSLWAPLPHEAFKAQIAFAYEPPSKIRPGETRSIHLLVKNMGNVSWPYNGAADGKYQLRVGNRWLDQSGNSINDGRGSLSFDLRPAETEEVAVSVNAPKVSGEYILEFDMVQEQVAWFREMGSEPLRVKVMVE